VPLHPCPVLRFEEAKPDEVAASGGVQQATGCGTHTDGRRRRQDAPRRGAINTPHLMGNTSHSMARTLQTRKRSGGPITRPFKKSRPMRRRRLRRGKKTYNATSQASKGGAISFTGRRTSKRKWKNLLWNSSIAQTHYRSNQSVAFTVTTTASPATQTVAALSTRRFSGANFWTTAGGAVNPDGGAIPTFATLSDITIRGGSYGIRISNSPDLADTDKDALQVTVFHVWTTKNFLVGALPASVNVGWDPTLVADFQTNIGRITMKKSFLVNEGDVLTIEKRMPIQKIDQTEYGSNYTEPLWIVLVGTTSATSTKALAATTYYNLSFVGDAV